MITQNAYDVIIIGAGHNGLTAAALLAKQGRKILVLERRSVIGGLAAGEEFHPGYRTGGLLHDTGQVRVPVVRALELQSQGLEIIPGRPSVLALNQENSGLLLGGDTGKTAEAIGSLSPRDAKNYPAYRAFIEKVGGVVNRMFDELPPDVGATDGRALWDYFKTGFALRRLGKPTMLELLRIAPMSIADWLNEWFETECLKAALAGAGLIGNFAGPWSPGTAFNLLLWECTAQHRIKGGPRALINALERTARAQGAEIRTEAEVSRVQVAEGRAFGVVLQSGERIPAAAVAASCDPRRTFLELVPADQLGNRLQNRIQHIRGTGATANVHLALNRPLEFSDRSGEKIEFARSGSRLDQLEKAFDDCKYGRLPSAPMLDIHVPTVSSPELAPPGHSVVSILAHFVPYHLEPRWDQDQVEKLGDAVVATLEQYAPGVSNAIVARHVLSPADLETRYGLVNGHILHGEHALDQLILRPVPECARCRTPIEGLYLCGSGSHPGGGITCGPGALAAAVIAQN